ncbi:hypothetical protein NXW75_19555 [Bacteroides xylanisolvens]|nr:hypothetical protein [Bacteroides xylanisolvens]
MSQWISIEAAAEKYRLEKEYIWLWVEMKKITVSYENDTVSIDDDSIQQFIKRTKLGITSEYIDELEQLCMEKNKTSRLYASLLNMRDQELMAIRGQSSRPGRFMENGGGTIRKTAILREEFYVGQRYL